MESLPLVPVGQPSSLGVDGSGRKGLQISRVKVRLMRRGYSSWTCETDLGPESFENVKSLSSIVTGSQLMLMADERAGRRKTGMREV